MLLRSDTVSTRKTFMLCDVYYAIIDVVGEVVGPHFALSIVFSLDFFRCKIKVSMEVASRLNVPTSAVGFKQPVYRRKRRATEVVGSRNVSSKLIVDHVAQKGISGLKVRDGDANVSFMPICRDSRCDLVTEPCSTSNVSAIDSEIDKTRPDKQIHELQTDRNLTGSKLIVYHDAQKGISGLKGGDSDANVSFMLICRDSGDDLVIEPCSTSNISSIDSQIDKIPDKKIQRLQTDRNFTRSNGIAFVTATVPPPKDGALSLDYKATSDVYGASLNCEEPSQASDYSELFEFLDNMDTKMVHNGEGVKDSLRSKMLTKMVPNDELEIIFELVGFYMHPMPISMVMLRKKGNEVYICVLCGYLMEKNRKLLIYKTSIKGENRGCPSFIGHTTIISPISKSASGRQILLDSSSLQFTPDGKCLVLLNNIKASYCREGSVDCQCAVCTSDSFEKNAVKVVQVKLGYVQVVCKLKTTNDVGSILVCEPSYLVVTEEGGRMNLWTMNSQWSAPIDKRNLPTFDSKSKCIGGLKRIPNFPDLIVGHSAFWDFYLW